MDRNKAVVIIDYGAGNLRSVVNAIAKLGYQSRITSDPSDMINADAVILPGVGAAADTMANLRRLGLAHMIGQFIAEGRPFLGVCIGLQILFTDTEEVVLISWGKSSPYSFVVSTRTHPSRSYYTTTFVV